MPRALLLDMDDTVLAYSEGVADAWLRVCVRLAPSLDRPPAEVYAAVERVRTWFWSDPLRHRRWRQDMTAAWAEIIRLASLQLGRDPGPLAREAAVAFSADREASLRPFPGALEAIARWRGAGVRLALITNGAAGSQRAKVERFGLAPLFDCVLIEGECGVGKPDPRIYRRALDAIGADPADTWMVGDNLEWEVAAPQSLGIIGIWVDVRGEGLPPGCPVRPDRIIRSLAELG